MKNTYFRSISTAILAGGMVLAQSTAPQTGGRFRHHGRMQAVATQLNLTDDQKAQAHEIFQSAAAAAKPLRDQMRGARQQLAADVRAGAAEEVISKDSGAIGALTSQLAVIRAKATQQFYQVLTPDQKNKFETMRSRRGGAGTQG
jgi:Spy/CpxP family protein refolding chaperone